MTDLTRWLAPDTLRTLGWSLLHFLWQGFALAAVASVAMTLFRRASTRYIVGVLTLLAMVASVATTFVLLLNSQSALQATEAAATPVVVFVQKTFLAQPVQPIIGGSPAVRSLSSQALPLLVEFWLAGVLFFTLRTAGSLIYLERLRRAASISVAPKLLAKCRELQTRLGLQRVIRFCECRWLDAPAVIGWFRPVVLLPVRALMGLSEDQIEAVIAHELAHIRRFDSFVNLFQVIAESLLFFHPAVWWLNKRVRTEREHCCDDVAIAACGNHLGYARALTTMEEWRGAPALGLAANGSPLAARISRILGLRHAAENRTAGLGASFVCFGAALIAASLLWGVSHPAAAERVERILFSPLQPDQAPAPNAKPALKPSAKASKSAEADPSAQSEPQGKSGESFIEGMKSVGIDVSDIDKLIALKIQGVTPSYVREIRGLGFSPSVDDLIGMRIQGVTPEYVKSIRDSGYTPNAEEIVGMKIQGVTPEYIKQMRDLGFKPSLEEVIGMKIQGVTPEYVQKMRGLGFTPDADQIVGMKIQGVTPEYVQQMRSLGFQPDTDEIVGMKIQGVTPEYVQKMRDLGFKPDTDQIIGMKIQGVTPEYVQEMRSFGFQPDVDEIVGMKIQGVTSDYVKALAAEGFKLNAEEVTSAKIMGITPEFIQKAKSHGFSNLSMEKLIQLKNANIF
ncbi:MAG TPA: M56 family metallopeptidase [Candidatus Sulfotelmatobacter sp.]|jgi:beta-lactamase regulating signal transducer with metallopeptidase domain|nr:M56 family metallopeptidase [Candidatus Sulfotelmatobacter sp.]